MMQHTEGLTELSATGQRNLNGRLSFTSAYWMGAPCEDTYYSYNENGQVEWMVTSQLGYYTKKL